MQSRQAATSQASCALSVLTHVPWQAAAMSAGAEAVLIAAVHAHVGHSGVEEQARGALARIRMTQQPQTV